MLLVGLIGQGVWIYVVQYVFVFVVVCVFDSCVATVY